MENEVFGFPTAIVREGRVQILVPQATLQRPSFKGPASTRVPVFYNPSMALNRDLSVLALKVHRKCLKREALACDALAGCGAKGLRLAAEVEGVKVLLNDINPTAVRLARRNIELNGLAERASVENKDARLMLLEYAFKGKRLDFVDVDPFGSPAIFVQAAVRSLVDGGLLALTATDTAVLNGVHPQACFRKYWAKPLRTEYHHEVGARLLLGYAARVALMHELGLSPLLTERAGYYVRAIVSIHSASKALRETTEALGFLYHCPSCSHRALKPNGSKPWNSDPKCPACGAKFQGAGPLWTSKLGDEAFSREMLREAGRSVLQEARAARRLLELIVGEAEAPPTYFMPHRMCKRLGVPIPSLTKITEGLRSRGYGFALTHFAPGGFRTDAPAKVVAEILMGR